MVIDFEEDCQREARIIRAGEEGNRKFYFHFCIDFDTVSSLDDLRRVMPKAFAAGLKKMLRVAEIVFESR